MCDYWRPSKTIIYRIGEQSLDAGSFSLTFTDPTWNPEAEKFHDGQPPSLWSLTFLTWARNYNASLKLKKA